ncbi:MAG: imidazolonepropionase [Hominenteromicrobium sp.]|uniref:imidazolonepropionase n=1 Tax=Hominenteromicrobium sp. TaxID=3073581 RepID=UPI0039930F4A
MSKRRYTNMQVLLPTIEKMLESGKNHREIRSGTWLGGDRPVHNLLEAATQKAAKGAPKFRGRKPAKTLQEYKYENKRLKMEVKLLQDFLQSTERK